MRSHFLQGLHSRKVQGYLNHLPFRLLRALIPLLQKHPLEPSYLRSLREDSKLGILHGASGRGSASVLRLGCSPDMLEVPD